MPQTPDGFIPDGFEPDATAAVAEKPKGQDGWFDTAIKVLNTIPGVPHPSDLKRLVEWLPTVGAATGGMVGGAGGTAFGMGFGGVPGAVGGAALGGAAGEAVRQNVRRVLGESAPATMTQAATDIGKEAAIQAGTELAGIGVAKTAVPVAKHFAGAIMQSAVKPGTAATAKALARGVAQEDLPVVNTLLNEGVNVSAGGLSRLRKIISATNKEVEDSLAQMPGKIYPEAAAQRAEDLIPRYANQVNPRGDVADVKGAVDEFLQTRPDAAGASQIQRPLNPLTPLEAQKLKTGTYRALTEKAYGELRSPAIEAQKAMARGLKEDIEAEAKKVGIDIGKMNMREADAITTLEAVAKRLAVKGNTDPISLAWLANNSSAGLGFVVSRSPAVKSMIARGLYKPAVMAARLPWLTPTMLRAMVSTVASGQETE